MDEFTNALQSHNSGRLTEALAAYRNVLTQNPDHFDALHNQGLAHAALGNWPAALVSYQKALAVTPDSVKTLTNLGNAYTKLGDLPKAIYCHEKAVALQPDYAIAHYNLGEVLKVQGFFPAAEKALSEAIRLKQNFPEAWCSLGEVQGKQGLNDPALTSFKRAIEINPNYINSYLSLADLYKTMGQNRPAEITLLRALGIDPQSSRAHYLLSIALFDQGRLDEAFGACERATALKPNFWQAHWWLAINRLNASIVSAREPQSPVDNDSVLTALETRFNEPDAIREGYCVVGIVQPFYIAYRATNNLSVLRRHGALCCLLMAHWQKAKGYRSATLKDQGRIRVGIVSNQICKHSVYTALIKGWLKHLDPALIDPQILSLGTRDDYEPVCARGLASRFVEGHVTVEQWTEAIIAAEPEVLIYPEIGMSPLALKLACMRLAPLQLASWGHPESTGLPTIDYYLSAECLENKEADVYYTERLVRLPGLGSCYSQLENPAVITDLCTLGLDLQRPLLLCPGNSYKYAQEHDWIFVELARRIAGVQLVFFLYPRNVNGGELQSLLSEQLQQRLEALFTREGLSVETSLRFIPWQEEPAFFDLMRQASGFLDTIGFSGFNTAMQAVACNLPIVTMDGKFLRGRLASGILKRMGLDDLVVTSPAAYIALAERLVLDRDFNHMVRTRIEKAKSVLFEDTDSVRSLQEFLLDKCRGR